MTAGDLPIPDGFAPAQFSPGFLEVSGPYFLKREAGSTIVGCRMTELHMNYLGVAHGGVLATLADVALSLQLYDSSDAKLPVSTVSMTTNFLSAARLGEWVEARAVIDRIGGRLAYSHGSISCENRILMTMSGVFAVIRPEEG
jgi:uncharacterized protein (TIGR00369 family)